nr:putative manganese transporter [uncultured Cetobacterium sp.]
MIEEIFHSGVEAFLGVGVFVSISLMLIGLIDYKFNGILIRIMEKSKKNQIFLAAILGLAPGCGGAIVIVPMYILGKVSFGALVTAFITTMGDAAFVLIVRDPKIYLWVLFLSGVVGIISGILIDYFNIGKNYLKVTEKSNQELKDNVLMNEIRGEDHRHIAHEKGDIVDEVLHEKKTSVFIYKLTHGIWYKVFWIIVILSLPYALEHLTQGHSHIHAEEGHNIIESLSFIATIGCIIYTLLTRKIFKSSEFDKVESKLNSVRETLIHTAEEAAFLITWIFVAFLFYNILVGIIGGEEILQNLISKNGFLVVVGATVLGLIPGCGPQILLTGLYVSGVVPFSALMANAICNDGDALFPLLALNKKSALMVTIYNVIPALLVGGIIYMIE